MMAGLTTIPRASIKTEPAIRPVRPIPATSPPAVRARPPECSPAAAGNDTLGDVGRGSIADEDGIAGIDHAEARGIAIRACRDAGLMHRHRFIQDGTPA